MPITHFWLLTSDGFLSTRENNELLRINYEERKRMLAFCSPFGSNNLVTSFLQVVLAFLLLSVKEGNGVRSTLILVVLCEQSIPINSRVRAR